LARDPVYEAILARGLLTQRALILDLGCGQGLLAALLLAARGAARAGGWPEHWPPAPEPTMIRGIELTPRRVKRARLALASRAEFVTADVCKADFGSADGVVMLDVLQYIERHEHRGILERVRAALRVDGILLLRVGNSAGGLGFRIGKWVDRTMLLARGRKSARLHYRSTKEWHELLSATGFESEAVAMSAGTLFANVLIIARPRAA
jgi:SAM-dependent methyltransferase